MGRKRIHTDAAERQRAYRERLEQPKATPARRRQVSARTTAARLSRPKRLVALADAAEELHYEFEAWLESMPAALESSAQYERLRATVDQLAIVVDVLGEVEPPRGYGRD